VATAVLEAEHPAGRLYAAVNDEVRFTEGAVSHSKFGASLTPFRTDDAAREALAAAGGTVAAPDPKRAKKPGRVTVT
jgi:hypothetical protein